MTDQKAREQIFNLTESYPFGGYDLADEILKVLKELGYRKVDPDKLTVVSEALEDMVWQFGYRGVKNNKPMIYTGGLSTLEGAFEALGWENPRYLPEEGYTCEVVGCMEPDTCGTHWGDSKLYLRICSKHYQDLCSGKSMPLIKQWALGREAKRDPITRCLPI